MRDFDRITLRPGVMGGKACIRGMRVTVGMIVGQIGSGRSIDSLMADYPYLEREDILQAVRYAAWLAGGNPHSCVTALTDLAAFPIFPEARRQESPQRRSLHESKKDKWH